MVLEERKCPNCGSNDVWEKDGTFACMNCKTFFDNPNYKKSEHVTTRIIRDETEIARIKAKERSDKFENGILVAAISFAFAVPIFALIMMLTS